MNQIVKTPAHLWIVGVVSLLWNAFGAYMYLMSALKVEAYRAQMTTEQLAWLDASPDWTIAAWAIGVWAAVAGSLLLLIRNRHAVTAFALSLFGLAASTLWQFALANPRATEILGPSSLYINLTVWVIGIALLLYARRQAAAGVLR